MPEYNKSQKMILLLQRIQQKNGAFASDLMQEFELDDRTLRRYLQDLRGLELPVERKRDTKPSGERDLRVWINAQYQRSGVQISLLEWISLHFGRKLFNFLKGTNFSQGMDDALERLSTITGDANIRLSQDLDRKFLAVPEHAKDHSKTEEIIEDILDCLLYQNAAEAHYSRIGGRMRRYILQPYTLATFRQGLYLFAYDTQVGQIKTFAVDRFQSFRRRRKESYELPESYDPQDIIRNSFGIMDGPVETIRLRFNSKAAPYIQERIWHHSQTLLAAPNGELIMSLTVGIAHELKSWILGFGPNVRVLEPQSLVEEIRDLHSNAALNY